MNAKIVKFMLFLKNCSYAKFYSRNEALKEEKILLKRFFNLEKKIKNLVLYTLIMNGKNESSMKANENKKMFITIFYKN